MLSHPQKSHVRTVNFAPTNGHVLLSSLICFSCRHQISGGTVVAALDLLKERGIGNKQIKVVWELADLLFFLLSCFYSNSCICICDCVPKKFNASWLAQLHCSSSQEGILCNLVDVYVNNSHKIIFSLTCSLWYGGDNSFVISHPSSDFFHV